MHWIIRAMLSDPRIVNTDGLESSALFARANRLLSEETTSGERLTSQGSNPLRKNTLLIEQQKKFKTPIVAYDETEDRVYIIDGWTLFTLRRRREGILGAL